jgi:hypothetical protein
MDGSGRPTYRLDGYSGHRRMDGPQRRLGGTCLKAGAFLSHAEKPLAIPEVLSDYISLSKGILDDGEPVTACQATDDRCSYSVL